MYFVHPQIKLNKKNLKQIFSCFLKTPDIKNLEKKLSCWFPNKQIIFTDMGRSAFQLIIEKQNLRNSAMLVPAYLCNIFEPIFKKYNISPVFLDINLKTFNLNPEEIDKKITPRAKSILVSHIYGLPNNMEKILSLAKKYNLKVIEDCAHTFGARQNGTYLGNFGDAAFFSLYKVFPSFRGGMLVCPKNWKIDLPKTSFSVRDFISFLNCFVFWAYLFKKFGSLIAPRLVRKEKMEKPAQINPVSLNLFSIFLDNYEKNLAKRTDLALFFQKGLKKMGFETQESVHNVFCYLSALVPNAARRDMLIQKLKKEKIFATRMWHTPLAVNSAEFPNTREAAQRIINFPLQNFYAKKDIEKILPVIQKTLTHL